MNITRLAGLTATTVLLGTVAACGGSSGASSPEDAAEKALQAVVDRDYSAACDIQLNDDDKPLSDEEHDKCVEEGKEALEKSDKALEDLGGDSENLAEEQQKKFEELLDTDPKVGDEKDGEVVVTYSLEGNDLPITVKKVDGDWYVKN